MYIKSCVYLLELMLNISEKQQSFRIIYTNSLSSIKSRPPNGRIFLYIILTSINSQLLINFVCLTGNKLFTC